MDDAYAEIWEAESLIRRAAFTSTLIPNGKGPPSSMVEIPNITFISLIQFIRSIVRARRNVKAERLVR